MLQRLLTLAAAAAVENMELYLSLVSLMEERAKTPVKPTCEKRNLCESRKGEEVILINVVHQKKYLQSSLAVQHWGYEGREVAHFRWCSCAL